MPGVPTSTLDMDALRMVVLDGWEYLQVPTLEEYSLVWKNSLYYGIMAVKNVSLLLYLSIRPVVNALYGMVWCLWNHLVWKFVQKSVVQLGYLFQKLYEFQRSLSPKQVALELILLVLSVLLYLLRRYIQKQAYVQRIQRWYKGKTRKIYKSYRSTLDRISQTSVWIAMIFPHALFAVVALGVKLLIPSVVTFVARDTPLYFLLSVVYPWISTVQLLYHYRNPKQQQQEQKKKNTENNKNKNNNNSDKENSSNKAEESTANKLKPFRKTQPGNVKAKSRLFEPTQSSQNRNKQNNTTLHNKLPGNKKGSSNNNNYKKNNTTTARRKATTKNTTTSTTTTTKAVDRFLAAKQKDSSKDDSSSTTTTTTTTTSLPSQANYWLSYWMMYSLVEGFTRMIFLLPIVGRLVQSTAGGSWVSSLTVELQLFWILWLFGLEYALQSTSEIDGANRDYKIRPLQILTKQLLPPTRKLYETISLNILSEETWNVQVCDKVRTLLEMAVVMKVLSKEFSSKIERGLRGSHPFLIPSLTLWTPLSFVTEYGVIYVKSIVPSCRRRGATKKTSSSSSLQDTCRWLQYWVLHTLFQAVLNWWSGILWWIPFSTHIVFLLWCRLPFCSEEWYRILEGELSAFGILGELDDDNNDNDSANYYSPKTLEDTLTVRVASQLWTSALKHLPSSVKDDHNNNNNNNNNKNDDDDDDTTTTSPDKQQNDDNNNNNHDDDYSAAKNNNKQQDSTTISADTTVAVPPSSAFTHDKKQQQVVVVANDDDDDDGGGVNYNDCDVADATTSTNERMDAATNQSTAPAEEETTTTTGDVIKSAPAEEETTTEERTDNKSAPAVETTTEETVVAVVDEQSEVPITAATTTTATTNSEEKENESSSDEEATTKQSSSPPPRRSRRLQSKNK